MAKDFMLKSVLPSMTAMLSIITTYAAGAAEPLAEADLREAVVAYFKGGDEPTVEAAVWTSEREFNVGVHYMGNPENSFARYVCSVLGKRGLGAGYNVNVIDINTMSQAREQWEVVGEAACKNSQALE